jgi:hypothetical protein
MDQGTPNQPQGLESVHDQDLLGISACLCSLLCNTAAALF